MKKIQKDVVIKKDVFVSIDGMEFNNEADCREWETSYKGTMAASWNLIKKIKANPCELGVPYANEDDECYMIKPKNLEEITLINAYIRSSTSCDIKLTTDHIDKAVIIDFGYDHDWCHVYIVENLINNITKKAAELESKLCEEV